MTLLLRWLINAIALYVATLIVPGIEAEGGWPTLIVTALVFGLVNALIRPLISFLTCPLIVLTLGLFTLVINALMLLLASAVANWLDFPFRVDGFGPAFWGALVITIVSFILSLVLREDRKK